VRGQKSKSEQRRRKLDIVISRAKSKAEQSVEERRQRKLSLLKIARSIGQRSDCMDTPNNWIEDSKMSKFAKWFLLPKWKIGSHLLLLKWAG
jgi:hypothetical protein